MHNKIIRQHSARDYGIWNSKCRRIHCVFSAAAAAWLRGSDSTGATFLFLDSIPREFLFPSDLQYMFIGCKDQFIIHSRICTPVRRMCEVSVFSLFVLVRLITFRCLDIIASAVRYSLALSRITRDCFKCWDNGIYLFIAKLKGH